MSNIIELYIQSCYTVNVSLCKLFYVCEIVKQEVTMKKILIVLLSIFILTALALSLVGCVEPRIVSITATYEQNDQKIYPSNSLSDLMKDLTVVAHYSNGKTNYDYTDYTLSGNLEAGISTITVTANNTNAITTFDVEVSAVMVVEINATFDTNGTTIYTSTDLETLKQYLTVKATYNDESVEENFTDYTLSGNLEAGISTITVTVNNTNLSTTFDVEVSAVMVVEIAATFDTNGTTIYTSTDLETLKQYLTVKATYNDESVEENFTDYTLSGNLEAGISTITVTVNNTNLSTTFDVEVSAVMVVEIAATFDTNGTTIYTSTDLETLKQYLTVKATYNDESVKENFTDYTLSGNLEAGFSTIIVTANNANAITTFDVEVSAVVVASIQVFEEQCKTHFIETDILNNEDFYVQVNYNDGSFKRITDFEMDKAQIAIDDTQIVFTYQGRQAILSITVEKKVVALEFEGYQQSYVDGEMFSCQNLKVYAVYLDNTKALVDDYRIDTADGCELALDSVVNVTVQNCTQELPIKVEYKSHEDYSLSYINQEKEYKISKYTGLDKEILLPEKIDNISVTTIGNEAFEDAPNLKVVKIQNNITSIENGAFDNCNQLFICVEADFAPDSWGDWNKNNFPVVWAFKTIVVDDYFDYAIFQEEVYITAYKGLAETVIVPDFIENYLVVSLTSAFADKTFLKNILLPEEIKEISSSMFSGCTSLQMVEIPSHITIIGDYAFKDCSSIESITIPSSVTSIGSYAFSGCRSLTTVTFGENSQLESIGSYAFYDCSSLTSITIPSSVTSIGSYAFSGCRSLTTVTFGENSQLESIGSYAFYDCSSLTSITIPSSVTSIGSYAFSGCRSLTTVTFGENSQLESIGSYAFYDCSSLTSITIPSSVTSIGSYAFYGCSSLTSITIPSSVTSIGSRAFYGCSRLQNVYYNGTMEDWCKIEFGSSSSNPMYCAENFYMWNGSEYDLITEIEIPETVTSISDCQFSGFKNLTSITIPSSVTSIGSYAFA